MKKLLLTLVGITLWANNCLECHRGIEPIRDPKSHMAKAIAKVASKAGFTDNSCIVCHGGNPKATTKEKAHKGTADYFLDHKGPKEFYPDPEALGSMSIPAGCATKSIPAPSKTA